MILPTCLETANIDNFDAECMALALLFEWIPNNIPRIIIMDSEAECSRHTALRDDALLSVRILMHNQLSGT